MYKPLFTYVYRVYMRHGEVVMQGFLLTNILAGNFVSDVHVGAQSVSRNVMLEDYHANVSP